MTGRAGKAAGAKGETCLAAFAALVTVALASLLPPPEFAEVTLRGALSEAKLLRLIHLVYDVRRDDRPLRRVAGKPGEFDKLRKFYEERREWSSLRVICDDATTADVLKKLGFNSQLK